MRFSTIFKKVLAFSKKNWPEIAFFTIFFLFSWWLMWHTFNYKEGVIYIASKAWSDFAANIPLIRSFSWGKNFPPEYPLFPGEPIRYHFLFYFLVGLLERVGLPLSWALNLPSVIGFWALLVAIFLLSKLLFEKSNVAFLAVIFFLFNGSLSFLEFFRQYPLSLATPIEIAANKNFPSFGPYDGKIVSAFWNLNIFTNQRHLGLAYFFPFLATYLLVKSGKSGKKLKFWLVILLGIGLGLFPFFHKAVFLMTVVVLGSFFLFSPKLRRSIVVILAISAILAFPQFVYQFEKGIPLFSLRLGYLVHPPLTVPKFISYWFFNLGLSLILIPLGVILAPRLAKKVFLAFFPLFLIGNLFQFSPEIAANHKFFNLFLIIGNMFSAWAICLLWKKHLLGKIIVPILIFFLTFSGIIDFFPVKNDFMYTVNDASKNPDVLWIKQNTPLNSVFLNSSYLYHPASLAGRKIFLGWPYFAWSTGYNTDKRDKLLREIYRGESLPTSCFLLSENNIDYVAIQEQVKSDFPINFSFFEENFISLYKNSETGFSIFSVTQSCDKLLR